MDDFSGVAALFERCHYGFGEHHGAVPAAGAAECDGEIAFAFGDVVGDQVNKQALDALQEFACLWERTNVTAYLGILTGEFAQTRDEMGVGKEPHIENQVGIGGHGIAVAETDHGDEHGTLVGIFEALGDEMAQLVDVELGGVNYDVGEFSDGLHEPALMAQAFADGEMFAEWVGAAGLAIATEQSVFAGVDEY